ncbi:hypothetical protein [Nocardia cyriacigeorgica]|uniref:hypothetical protein n=1 Tax=Nocardia cyriacigeorgica TaxID=135487 RepID=UPI002458A8C0|nr:hypothetical protein [Nocardia cyriacigeorgica]
MLLSVTTGRRAPGISGNGMSTVGTRLPVVVGCVVVRWTVVVGSVVDGSVVVWGVVHRRR